MGTSVRCRSCKNRVQLPIVGIGLSWHRATRDDMNQQSPSRSRPNAFAKFPLPLVPSTSFLVLLLLWYQDGRVLAECCTTQALQPQVLFNFPGNAWFKTALVPGPDGCFYGTTQGGGGGIGGQGTVFRATTDGRVTTLVNFNQATGYSPTTGPLTLGSDGAFYGTTYWGGNSGDGMAFKVTTNGALAVLASFSSAGGMHPLGGLTRGSDGNFYGAMFAAPSYDRAVFKMTPEGNLTTLVNFPSDYGSFPGGLTRGRDGNLYGTTANGLDCTGTFFRVTASGVLSRLAELSGCPEAYSTPLTLGNDGRFYGTTFEGGSNHLGTVFRATRRGKLATLVNFTGPNGALPSGPLTLGSDGNFYGTTVYGGVFEGTVFRVRPHGALTTLGNFTSRSSGVRPYSGVTFGTDGSLYGTTITGGSMDGGVLFRLDLAPTLLSQPAGRTKGVGTTVTFRVRAFGTRPYAYQWLKDGTNLADDAHISGANSNTLRLTDIQTNDAGNFSVLVTKRAGCVTSEAARLTVLGCGQSALSSAKADISVLLQAPSASSPAVTLAFEGVPNYQYLVQYTTNLTDSPLLTLSTNIASANGSWTVIDFAAATNGQRFYRAVSTSPAQN